MLLHPILVDDFRRIADSLPDRHSLSGSRWLITGVTGMICSYFTLFLSWLNEEELDGSLCISAMHRGELQSNDQVIGYLLNKKYISFRKIDLGHDFALDEDDDFDYVVHGATSAAPRGYLADPVGTINVNVLATHIMLEHFRSSSRLKSFLYMSSGEIYGNPDSIHVPTPETYLGVTDHLSPRSCYVESKRFTETLCLNYFRQYQVPIRIIRPVQLFGPGFKENDSRAWVDFISKTFYGNSIEILGDGTSRRGYCYLADAVNQIMVVIQKGTDGDVYNIGNEEHISIRELADMIASFGRPPVQVLVQNNLPAYLQGSPQLSCPSIKKIKSLAPLLNTSIKEGMNRSYDWFSSIANRNEVVNV
jgi:UDP-glucuronate decarboxylase